MSFGHAIDCINAYASTNGGTVCFSGGEPTLYSQFSNLLSYVNRIGLSSQLTTNGSLLHLYTDEQLRNIGILHISLHSLTEQIYNKITRPENKNSFSHIKQSLNRLMNLNIKFTINAVYLDEYPNEIEKIIRYCEEKNIDIQIMNNMLADSNYYLNYYKFINEPRKEISLVKTRKNTNPSFIFCNECEKNMNCASTRAIWCFPNKNISICPHQKNLFHNFDNIEYSILYYYNYISESKASI